MYTVHVHVKSVHKVVALWYIIIRLDVLMIHAATHNAVG